MLNWASEVCGQTVLPDRSVVIGQKLMENAKMPKFKWDILGDFQIMCVAFFVQKWDFDVCLPNFVLNETKKLILFQYLKMF